MKLAIPRIWRELKKYVDECYFYILCYFIYLCKIRNSSNILTLLHLLLLPHIVYNFQYLKLLKYCLNQALARVQILGLSIFTTTGITMGTMVVPVIWYFLTSENSVIVKLLSIILTLVNYKQEIWISLIVRQKFWVGICLLMSICKQWNFSLNESDWDICCVLQRRRWT